MKSKRTNIAAVWDLGDGTGNFAVSVDGRILFVTRNEFAADCVAADYNKRHTAAAIDTAAAINRAISVLR